MIDQDVQGGLQRSVSRVTVGHDGESCVLGRPDLGVYVAVPAPGGVFVTALQDGRTLAEATALAGDAAGEPVDGEDFLAGLTAAGLLDAAGEAGEADEGTGGGGHRIRWIEGVSPAAARRLFGRVGWTVYAASAVFATAVLIGWSQLRPSWENVWFLADPLYSVLVYLPVALLLRALHEAWHWLAGRAVGVPAAFRVSYRGIFLVFETDLTQIVGLPRRLRHGPFLAGMAIDAVVLAGALAARLAQLEGLIALPAVVDRFLGVVVLYQVFVIVWQWAAVFLRSDGYAILANALRCHSLYRTTWLTAKDRLLRLSPSEHAELASADGRDRAVARWFALVYVAGVLALLWMFLTFVAPFMVAMTSWIGGNVVGLAVATGAFWKSAAVLFVIAAQYALPALLAARERRMRKAGQLL